MLRTRQRHVFLRHHSLQKTKSDSLLSTTRLLQLDKHVPPQLLATLTKETLNKLSGDANAIHNFQIRTFALIEVLFRAIGRSL